MVSSSANCRGHEAIGPQASNKFPLADSLYFPVSAMRRVARGLSGLEAGVAQARWWSVIGRAVPKGGVERRNWVGVMGCLAERRGP